MADKGPSYGLSAELKMKQEAKYDPEKAKKCLEWINKAASAGLDVNKCRTDEEFAEQLKSGQALCKLINAISPGSVGRINTMSAPFKQRENIEMYLKACTAYGLKEQDLFQVPLNNRETLSTKQFHFQVNDLYENKNLYMVVDNLYNLGGMVSIKISNRLKTNICTMTPLIKRVIFIFKSKYLGVFTVHCSTFRPRRMVGTAQCWG